jgi:hypothetical protein
MYPRAILLAVLLFGFASQANAKLLAEIKWASQWPRFDEITDFTVATWDVDNPDDITRQARWTSTGNATLVAPDPLLSSFEQAWTGNFTGGIQMAEEGLKDGYHQTLISRKYPFDYILDVSYQAHFLWDTSDRRGLWLVYSFVEEERYALRGYQLTSMERIVSFEPDSQKTQTIRIFGVPEPRTLTVLGIALVCVTAFGRFFGQVQIPNATSRR